ncbi:hypothetical protein GDO81_019651 [Engystomops pustulosus]|uniref:NADP-dependent oxidoreductase domain-containing protein n=1 Tax=Engystomops pustulosus TaxID=76066 RepID=A0AAV6ZHZ9_ENGPU|nr:hypothetical protein GDO81_019651 [Engystomops pustulosus]
MELREDSYVTLNDGHKMPVIGFGTYAPLQVSECMEYGGKMVSCRVVVSVLPKSLAEEGVKVALEVGYLNVLFQLWSTFQAPDKVRPAVEKSLQDLQLDYIDLFIIHSPIELKPGDNPFPVDENGKLIYHNTDIRETWKALEECKDAGLVRSIGVSNFNKSQVELILNNPELKYKPVCNQVECHIYLNQSKLQEFLKSHDIVLVGYSVLGSSRDEKWIDQNSPVLLEDPVLKSLAEKLGRTPAQVAMRFLLQRGIVVLAKSFTPARIKQNFQVFDFQLSEDEMKTLEGLNKNMRYIRSSQYPFHDEY